MTDTFRDFLNTAGRYPLLTANEEVILSRQVQAWVDLKGQDPAELTPRQKRDIRVGQRAYNKFFQSNIRLVVNVAKKFAYICNFHTMDDLIQEGCIGLARAIEKFDGSRGYKFSTYAYWWIRQAIQRSMTQRESHIRLPINAVDKLHKIKKWMPSFYREHRRVPTIKEMAEFAELSVDAVKSYLPHISGVGSLDIPTDKQTDGGSTLIDFVPDTAPSLYELIEQNDAWEVVRDSLPKLREREKNIISSHWGLNGHEKKTLNELAQEDGASRERIRQVELQGINKLRRHLAIAGVRP